MLTLTKIVEQDEEVLRHMLKIDTHKTHSKDNDDEQGLSEDEIKEDLKDDEDKESCNNVNSPFIPHPKIETTRVISKLL